MSNAATIKAITANIREIITDTLEYKFEDVSKDPDVDVLPLAQLDLGVTRPQYNHGEGPMYIEQEYTLTVKRKIASKAAGRLSIPETEMDIEEAITVATLNVNDLAASKLVSWVTKEYDTESDDRLLTVTADMTVRFRRE